MFSLSVEKHESFFPKLGTGPSALVYLGKHSTTELNLPPWEVSLIQQNSYSKVFCINFSSSCSKIKHRYFGINYALALSVSSPVLSIMVLSVDGERGNLEDRILKTEGPGQISASPWHSLGAQSASSWVPPWWTLGSEFLVGKCSWFLETSCMSHYREDAQHT